MPNVGTMVKPNVGTFCATHEIACAILPVRRGGAEEGHQMFDGDEKAALAWLGEGWQRLLGGARNADTGESLRSGTLARLGRSVRYGADALRASDGLLSAARTQSEEAERPAIQGPFASAEGPTGASSPAAGWPEGALSFRSGAAPSDDDLPTRRG